MRKLYIIIGLSLILICQSQKADWVPAYQIGHPCQSSSFHAEEYDCNSGKLHFKENTYGWFPTAVGDYYGQQWMGVSSDLPVRWVGVKLSSTGRGWLVKDFKVAYTFDGISWYWINDGNAFQGVSGYGIANSVVREFPKPVDARALRFFPLTHNGHQETKLEFYYQMWADDPNDLQ